MEDPNNEDQQQEPDQNVQRIQVPASEVDTTSTEPFQFTGTARFTGEDDGFATLELSDMDFGQAPDMDNVMDRAINQPDEKQQ